LGYRATNAFEVLKKAFTTAPVLRIPNDKDPFKLSTDVSDFATRAVLSQKDMQTNLWHPVAFFSKSLDVHKRNYEIYDKELLVVIQELEEYRHHLEGHSYKVEIWVELSEPYIFQNSSKANQEASKIGTFYDLF